MSDSSSPEEAPASFLETSVSHKAKAQLQAAAAHHAHAYRNEPCYPPPCPGYEYTLPDPLTEGGGGGANGGNNPGGSNGGPNGAGDGTEGPGGENGANNNPGGSDNGGQNGGPNDGTGSNGEGPPTPLGPDAPEVVASSGGAAPGASGFAGSSSSATNYWVTIDHPPPDPKAGKTDLEGAGCCNPALAADRAKMLELQKKIDAQTEVRAGHIKWMQDASDAIAKVMRQISATNETVYELTQDIQVLEQQIDQIQKKIRADILKQNLEAAQDELNKIKENQSSIDAQKDKIQAKADALIQKTEEINAELKKVPHQNIELVAFKYDPNSQL